MASSKSPRKQQYRRAEVSIDEDAKPNDALELTGIDDHVAESCVTLEACELSYWVRGRNINSVPKQLICNVSMKATPGEVLAIMGPSGAGKTTLLDILAARKRNGLLHGVVTLNGYPIPDTMHNNSTFSRNIGYVLQGDLHLPQLTVLETISFAAALRLDAESTPEVLTDRVNCILSMMRLKSISNIRIGGVNDSTGVTLTDGELKRLSLAVEMVSLPALMFCDEPTTGLDAPTAYDVMKSVSYLAHAPPYNDENGENQSTSTPVLRTICVTVHQPSIEVFSLCSKVLLLGSGRVIYFGPTDGVVEYFSSSYLNFEFEEGSNPADFIVAIAGGGLVSELEEQPTPPSVLADLFKKSDIFFARNPGSPRVGRNATIEHLLAPPLSTFPPPWMQFKLLMKRAWLSISRRHDILLTQLLKSVVIALFVGLIYHKVFENPDASWIVIFDDACALGNNDVNKCLTDIPHYSTNNVTCYYNERNDKCKGSHISKYGGPSLNEELIFAPVCSIAPMYIANHEFDKLHDACHFLNKYMGRDEGCRIEGNYCVAGPDLGIRLSSASLNACSLFFIAILYTTMGNLQEIPRLFESRRLFKREVSSGAYPVIPLWASQLLVHLPVQIGCFTVFFNLIYWLIGIPTGENAANYFYCYALLLTSNAVGFAYAQFLAISAPSSDWALAVFPISFLFFSSFSGFVLLVDDIPLGWRWGRYLSFVRWGFEGFVSQIFGSIHGGDGVIKFWGFQHRSPAFALFMLMVFCGALNLGALFWMFEPRSRLVVRTDSTECKNRQEKKKLFVRPTLFKKIVHRSDSSLDLEAMDLDPLTSMLLDEDGMTSGERAVDQLAKLHPSHHCPTTITNKEATQGSSNSEDEEMNMSPRRKHHVEVCDYCVEGSQAVGMRLMFLNIRLSVRPTGLAAHNWFTRIQRTVFGGDGPYDHLVNDTPSPTEPSGQGEKDLLQGVSGRAQPGEILAVMGPSGAGKTSLIELLAGRKRPDDCTAQGQVLINGREVEASQMWRFSSDAHSNSKTKSKEEGEDEEAAVMDFAYVAQLNHHVGVLTVRETLEVAVALRLTLSDDDLVFEQKETIRSERVRLLLDMLGLKSIENVLVSSSSSGLSGGEAKRLSIAVEVVNLPSLIFLDEPTSGLDSMTAHEVSAAIRALANQNRTIITTIHQPSVTTFCLFDNLLLLSDGNCAYYGPLRRAVPYFVGADLGISYRRGLNPADFLVAAVSSRDSHELALKYQDSDLYKVFVANVSTTAALDITTAKAQRAKIPTQPPSLILNPAPEFCSPCDWARRAVKDFYRPHGHPSSFPEQVRALVTRNSLHALREPRGLFGVALRHIVVSIFFATLYRVNSHSNRNPQNVASLLFFSIFFIAVGHQHSMPVMIAQRMLWLHERRLKLYSTRSLYFSQLIMKWPTHIVCILVYSLIVYPSCGLRSDVGAFVFFVFILIMASVISLSLCELIASVSPSAQAAIVFYLPVSFYFMAFGGYLVLIPSLPHSIDVFPASSYMRWAFQGLLLNQYEKDDGIEEVVHTYGFTGFHKEDSILPLLFMLLVFEGIKFSALRFSTG